MTHTPGTSSTYTTNLGLEKAAEGSFSNSWADLVNDNLDLIDAAGVRGHSAIVSLSGSVVTARNRFGGIIESGTDANTVIQAALDGIGSGTCYLSTGQYGLTEPLSVPTGVVLCSNPHPVYSSESTYYVTQVYATADFSGGTGTGGIVQLANRSGIAGLRVKGVGGVSEINGISAASVRSVLIQGCRVTNCYRGVQGAGLLGGQILDSEFRWNLHAGISGGITDTVISRCFFPVNYGADIWLTTGACKVQIADCTLEWGSVEGVRLDGASMVSVNGCMFDRKGKEAIYLDSSDHVAIVGNCFRRSCAASRNAHICAVDSQFSVTGNEYAAADILDGEGGGAITPDYVYEIGSGCTVKYYEDPAAQAVGVTVPGAT